MAITPFDGRAGLDDLHAKGMTILFNLCMVFDWGEKRLLDVALDGSSFFFFFGFEDGGARPLQALWLILP